jgi:transposase-like protein
MLSIDDLLKGRHFDREIIILCVRWYLRFKLSFRDLVEMMVERGISLAHTTIMRWIQRYVPEFEKRWNRFACRTGAPWRVDETYVKIKGRWTYLYRAVDKEGKTVDFVLRAKRDIASAKAFFRRAFKSQGRPPRAITLDGYQASHRAAREILGQHRRGKRTKIRSSKYLRMRLTRPFPFHLARFIGVSDDAQSFPSRWSAEKATRATRSRLAESARCECYTKPNGKSEQNCSLSN